MFNKINQYDTNGYIDNNKTIVKQGVTKKNNEYCIFKDNTGNTIYTVDYSNNNPKNIFDESEIRDSEGNLVSYTERSYTTDNEMLYTTHCFDKNGKQSVFETHIDSNGNTIGYKELSEQDNIMTGRVHLGISNDGNWGDLELQKILNKHGASIIGKN